MAEARTKMEFLYQAGLADVDALVVRIEALEENLPNIVKGIENDLAGIVGQLVVAATQVKEAVRAETKNTVNGALGQAKEAIRADANKARDDALMEIRQAVRAALDAPVGQLLVDLKEATSNAEGKRSKTLLYAVGAAILGGVVAGLLVFWLTKPSPAPTDSAPVAEAIKVTPTKKGK